MLMITGAVLVMLRSSPTGGTVNCYSTRSRSALARTRRRFGLADTTEVHHIIPREFRQHRLIRDADFPMNGGYNLMLMPNALGKQAINTTRPCHQGGHGAYNKYVRGRMECLSCPTQLPELVRELRQRIRLNCVPWRD
jgi:hypothetical protein